MFCANAIDKTFPETGVHANNSVSFRAEQNEVIGIIGDNGAGKSTLVTILAGELAADSGSISLDGTPLPNGRRHPAVGLVHQHPRVLANQPVWESIMIGLSRIARIRPFRRQGMRGFIAEQLQAMGIDLPLDIAGFQLSVGQLHLAELAAVLLQRPEVLILDEPTAACTPEERDQILNVIRQQRDSHIIYISHRHTEVRELCSRVLRLDHGELAPIDPAELTPTAPRFHNQIGSLHPHLPPICSIENVSARSAALGQLEDISIQVFPGEIVGITGYRDHGLLLLEDTVSGNTPPATGAVRIRGREIHSVRDARQAGMRYIPSQRFTRGLAYTLSVVHSLREHILLRHPESVRAGLWVPYQVRQRARDILQRHNLPPDEKRPLRSFSGGMRQRVLIGRETDVDDAVMAFALVCEPTLGLDRQGCDILWNSLRELSARGAGILLISSAAEEIQPICSRMLQLENGRIAAAPRGES